MKTRSVGACVVPLLLAVSCLPACSNEIVAGSADAIGRGDAGHQACDDDSHHDESSDHDSEHDESGDHDSEHDESSGEHPDGGTGCGLSVEQAMRLGRATLSVNSGLVSLTGEADEAFLADESGNGADFVVGQLALYTNDPSELSGFLGRWRGTVLETSPASTYLPAGYLIAIDLSRVRSPRPEEVAHAMLLDDPCQIAHDQVSSQAGLATLVAAARERERGIRVDLQFHDLMADIPNGFAFESFDTVASVFTSPSGYSPDVFQWVDYRPATFWGEPDTGVTRAWQVRASTSASASVVVGVIDGGFELVPAELNVPVTFTNGRQGLPNRAKCTGGNACPWHGTTVALSIAGAIDNSFGGAGTGTPAVREIRVADTDLKEFNFVSALRALIDTVPRPDIINISSGGFRSRFAWAFSWYYRRVLLSTTSDSELGILVVAAAGNEAKNLDATDSVYVPCEARNVLCVGSMNNFTTVRASYPRGAGTNIGGSVDLFAPHPRIALVNADGSVSDTEVAFGGTSGATPYVVGVAALVRSIDPSLHGLSLQDRLHDTRHFHATDPIVRQTGVVNAYAAAVATAGHNVPPTIQVFPSGGATIPDIRVAQPLTAQVSDVDGDPLTVRWLINGVDTGKVGTTFSPSSGFFPHPGLYAVTATVSDGTSVRSSSIAVVVQNLPISISIESPTTGQIVRQGTPITLHATVDDDYGIASLVWTASGEPGGTILTGAADGSVTFSQLGTQTISLIATDVFGGSASAATTINVVPDVGGAPVITVLAPTPGTTVFVNHNGTGYLSLAATATDLEDGALGDAAFTWYVNGSAIAHAQNASAIFGPPVCSPTPTTVRVEVRDSDGHESFVEIPVMVDGDCGG